VRLTWFARGSDIDDLTQTLNLIGFQKVLKKWEKVTHMAIQDVYLKEKVANAEVLSWICY